MDNIYEMKLHETIQEDDGTGIMRVAGGWIYTVINDMPCSVFVPFHNEFMAVKYEEATK